MGPAMQVGSILSRLFENLRLLIIDYTTVF